MSLASQNRSEAAAPAARPAPALSKWAALVWLLQLVLPTVGLAHVVWLRDRDWDGRFGQLVLALCLVWYAGCALGLAVRASRRWIAAHPSQLMALSASVLAAVAAAEVVVRVCTPTRMVYSPELGWRLAPGVSDVGPDGWRRPTYPPDKAPGRYRVVCLGDSTTFGLGCSWEEAWPHQLEKLLNGDPDWVQAHGSAEVVNLGVPGYGPDQALIALQKFGLAYSPDLVIFHLCANDFADASYDHDWRNVRAGTYYYKPMYVLDGDRLVLRQDRAPPPPESAAKPVFRLSLVPFLRDRAASCFPRDARKVLTTPNKGYWPVHEAYHSEYVAARPLVWALIKEMARVSSDAGAGFLLTLSPTHLATADDAPPLRVASFLREYEDHARAAGVTALNCVPEFFERGGLDRFLLRSDPLHLNAEGNALVAETSRRRLREAEPAAAHGATP